MALKSLPIFLAILSVMAVVVPIIADDSDLKPPIPPRFVWYKTMANLKAPEVVAAARFAVAEHNKEIKKSLKLVSTVYGESRPVDKDVNYRLVVSAKDDSTHKAKLYTTEVLKYPKGGHSLVSFQIGG